MPRQSLFKHLVVIMAVLVVCACSGGGCSSGCAGCGMTPLPEGFPAESRVENAGSVRLTSSGLAFIEKNLGSLAQQLTGMGMGGVVTFPVPTSSGNQSGIQYEVCPDGPMPNGNPPTCTAEIDIGSAQLSIDTQAPRNIHVYGPLPIRLQDLPLDITYFGFITSTVHAVLNGNDTCPGEAQTYAQIPIDVNISVEIDGDMAHSRYGYSRIKIASLAVDEDALQDQLHFCGGFDASILNGLKGIAFGQLIGPLLETLQSQVEEALCQQANRDLEPPCPSGSTNDDGTCRYPDGSCVSIVLGTDGHIDLSGLLASLSPGTKGGLDILFAAGGHSKRDDNSNFSWGDLNPIGGGATLGMYGGALPQPVSKCVPLAELTPPAGIPIPDELLANTVDGWPASLEGPHVGVAVSERFANYALGGIYNSGLLCIGITTDAFDLLNSSTLRILIPSLETLALQKETQPVALVVRPSQPPTVTFGNGTDLETDPLLRVRLPAASFDFYIWSLDRYIRFMTATFDLDVPVNLTVTPDGLVPVLDKIGVDNGKITNAQLLSEPEAQLVSALQDIISSQVGSALGGGINPINLNEQLASLGLTLTIPDTVEGQGSPGLRKLTKGSDAFLGIFATLGTATAPMIVQPAETSARVIAKAIDPAGLRAPTLRDDNRPVFTLELASPSDDGSRVVEYSFRVDGGFWKPWTKRRFVDVSEPSLRLEGRHVIEVRARVAGQPESIDPTPAVVEVLVDDQPPHLRVSAAADSGTIQLDARDLVSGEATMVRTRLDGGAWSEWMPASAVRTLVVGDASEVEVEAKDEEGNIATVQQALVRGKPIPNASACGCSVPGGDRTPASALFMLAIALAGAAARIARRLLGGAAIVAAAGSHAGCSCDDDATTKAAASGGGTTCTDPCRALEPGLIGAYTSAAVSGSTVWVAGYLEADYNHGDIYGDLVVGRLGSDGKVAWEIVDGVPDPTEYPVDGTAYDKNGFRGGQTEPGPDVGLWTSIAIDGSGNPAVAYYDRTNRALKYASFDGSAWQTSTVEAVAGSDLGKYAKLVFQNGTPVIAYLAIEPGEGGSARSKVRIATGPAGSWTFEDAYVDEATPCRKHLCPSGTECVADTLLCTPALDKDACNPSCASGTACIDQNGTKTCVDVLGDNKLDSYPDAAGDYISLAIDASNSLALAFYDRIHGNVVVASKASGTWTSMVVDGQAPDGTDTGDVGVGTSLFVDSAGDWHLAYVDGHAESLKYLKITQGTTPGVPEIVDDGLGLPDGPFADNQHLVGDDAHIVVAPSGEVRITYQDATSGTLRQALGTPSGAGHTWELRAYEQTGFAGAFSGQVVVDGQLFLMNWWRVGGERVEGDVAFVTP